MTRAAILALCYLSLSWTVSGQDIDRAADSPPPAKTIEEVAVPVPSEIFASLDKFENSNWRAVQRPEVTRWKSRGDQAQIALLLGVAIAEGFIAAEAKDSAEVEEVGAAVLKLSRGLGVEGSVIRRSRSIVDQARSENWTGVRKEWDAVFTEVERAMKTLKSDELPQLVSLGGWLRGTEALTALVLQNYSADGAALLHQPTLLDHFKQQLRAMSRRTQAEPIVGVMRKGVRDVRPFIAGQQSPAKSDVEKLSKICAQLLDQVKTTR
jgi:hypothetical protein